MKERVEEALLVFIVPPSMETLFERLRARATEIRRRAGDPPAQRRHRAGPAGGLRLRRDQRDRAGRADGGADRRDHRSRARAGARPSRPAVTAGRDRRRVVSRLGDPRPGGGGPPAPRRRASPAGRLVEVAVDAAGGRGSTFTYLVPPALADLERRRGGAGRVRPAAGAGGRPRRGDAVARDHARPIVDRVRADGPLLPPLGSRARPRDRAALSCAAGARPPGDASARAARTARARRRARAGPARRRLPSRVLDAVDADLLGAARRRALGRCATSPDPTAGPGLLRRLRALAARGTVSLEWTLLGGGRRAALRTMGAADRDRPCGRTPSRGRRNVGPAAARAEAAGGSSSAAPSTPPASGPARTSSARFGSGGGGGPGPARSRRGRRPRASASAAGELGRSDAAARGPPRAT